jgi:hypothetical protein
MSLVFRLANGLGPGGGGVFAAGVFNLIMREIDGKSKKVGKRKISGEPLPVKLETTGGPLDRFSMAEVTLSPFFCYAS